MTNENTKETLNFNPEYIEERNDFPFDLPYVVDYSTYRRYVRAEALYKYIHGVDIDSLPHLDVVKETKERRRSTFKKWCKDIINWYGLEWGHDFSIVCTDGEDTRFTTYLTYLDHDYASVYFHLPTAWAIITGDGKREQRREVLAYLSRYEENDWQMNDYETAFDDDDTDPYEEVEQQTYMDELEDEYKESVEENLDVLERRLYNVEEELEALKHRLGGKEKTV